jgi:hypothetical protein
LAEEQTQVPFGFAQGKLSTPSAALRSLGMTGLLLMAELIIG